MLLPLYVMALLPLWLAGVLIYSDISAEAMVSNR